MEPEIRCGQHISNWNYYKIGELCEILTGFPFPGCQIVKAGKNLLMRGINITEGYIRHSEDIDRYYDGDTTNLEKYRLKIGDLVIGMDGSKVGKNSALITSKENNSLLVQRVARLRNKDKNLIRLIQIAVSSSKFLKYIEEMKTSSAIPHISSTDIKGFTISLSTDLNERNLLASYFQSLDSLIQTTSKKLASLKQIKAASLQSMFPQEGETVPKVRFKGFEEEWKYEILGKISSISIGEFVIQTKQRANAPYPVYNGGITNTGYYDYFNQEGPKIIISARGANAGFINKYENRFWAGNSCYSIGINNNNWEFIYYFLQSKQDSYLKKQQAANIPSISKKQIYTTNVLLPCYNEQIKIGLFFSNLDKQISLQAQRLEKLTQIKAACLDKMFV